MKGLFIADFDTKDNKNSGITKKIQGMYRAFLNNNIEMDLMFGEDFYTVFKINNTKIKLISNSRQNRYNMILEKIKEKKYDFIFIRYMLSNYFFVQFLQKIKEINSKIKIVIEFPTMPYDDEIKNSRILKIDIYYRKLLNKYVDLAISYNKMEKVLGIRAFVIGNGIEIEGKDVLKYKDMDENKIKLIGVGSIARWHGYDRVIKGIGKYNLRNKQYNIEFTIVGEGEEVKNLVNIINDLNINDYVRVIGYKKGEELFKLYEEADIGIGTLNRSRINLKDGSALKHREYCCVGLPFLYAGDDIDFDENFEYALKIDDDEEDVNIESVIEFIKSRKSNKLYPIDMRKYAELHLDWNSKVKRIIDQIYNCS